ncbi:MAG: glycosyltransferase family 9 protein [Caldilineales bacterium]
MNLQRILVIKLADIGDLLTASPALGALRETFPDAQIDVLTTPAAAPALSPWLRIGVLTVPRNLVRGPGDVRAAANLLAGLRRARYDAVAILHHLTLRSGAAKYRLLAAATGAPVVAGLDNGNGGWLTHAASDEGFGACHEVEYWLRVVELLGATREHYPTLTGPYREDDRQSFAPLLATLGPPPVVVIHPGSGGYSMARRWEPIRWAELADALIERFGAQIVLVGTPTDGADVVVAAMTSPCRNLAGRTTVPELAAVLSDCDLFLGADSGVMHLATSVGAPVVALFGPSNHLAWGPWNPEERKAAVVRLDLRCSPCSYVGHSVGQRDGCWHRSCMAELTVQQVLDAAAGFLDQGRRPGVEAA